MFWSFLLYFLDFEVSQGCYCNYHIFNIILKKPSGVHVPACGQPHTRSIRTPKMVFQGSVRKISTPSIRWCTCVGKAPPVWRRRPFLFFLLLSLSTLKFAPPMQNFRATPAIYFSFTFGLYLFYHYFFYFKISHEITSVF